MTTHEPQAYDMPAFCRGYSISRSFAYLEIKAGRLMPFKAGRKTLISREAAEAWRHALEGASPPRLRPAPPASVLALLTARDRSDTGGET